MGNAAVKKHCATAEKTGALNLSNSKLNEFPAEMGGLKKVLRLLNISSNRFSKLPVSIGDFTNLKTLTLDNNILSDLPSELGLLIKLETLSVSNNRVQSLPSSVAACTQLKTVHLQNNSLNSFPISLCKLPHLDFLDLSSNSITEIPEQSSTLHVTELVLNQNQIRQVSDGLASAPRLKTLRLQENCLDISNFPLKLLTHSSISTLHVEGNLFDMKQFAQLEGYDTYMERFTAVKKKLS